MPRKMKGTRVTPEMVPGYTSGTDMKKEARKEKSDSVKNYRRPGQPSGK